MLYNYLISETNIERCMINNIIQNIIFVLYSVIIIFIFYKFCKKIYVNFISHKTNIFLEEDKNKMSFTPEGVIVLLFGGIISMIMIYTFTYNIFCIIDWITIPQIKYIEILINLQEKVLNIK